MRDALFLDAQLVHYVTCRTQPISERVRQVCSADLSVLASACIATPLRLQTMKAVGCRLTKGFHIEGANSVSTGTFEIHCAALAHLRTVWKLTC